MSSSPPSESRKDKVGYILNTKHGSVKIIGFKENIEAFLKSRDEMIFNNSALVKECRRLQSENESLKVEKERHLNEKALSEKMFKKTSKQRDDAEARSIAHKATIRAQQDRIKSMKEDIFTLTDRINKRHGSVYMDAESYETFKIGFNIAVNDANRLRAEIARLAERRKDLKLMQIQARDGATRLTMLERGEAVEYVISKKWEELKATCKNKRFSQCMKDVYETQTPEIKDTMMKLGWFGEGNLEYKVGMLYDVARIHNHRPLIVIADTILKSVCTIKKSIANTNPLVIPIRSCLMRESLARDTTAKSMAKKKIEPQTLKPDSEFSKVMKEMDILIPGSVMMDFPTLPKVEKEFKTRNRVSPLTLGRTLSGYDTDSESD